MKKKLLILVLAALPALCLGQSAIDGTWKNDIKSAKLPTKPSRYVVKDGTYQCVTCVPAFKVKADGSDQPVAGNPYFDTLAVKITDDHTIELATKKSGKPYGKSKIVVAADGKTMMRDNSTVETSGMTTSGTMSFTRVAAGPKGGHAMSGEWKIAKLESGSETKTTFKTANGVLTMTSDEGATYEAKLDGTPAAVKGDPGTQMVKVTMKGKNTFEETSMRDGKAVFVNTMVVDADGKKAKVSWTNKLTGTSGSYMLVKQ
jgi:hypothetical protein